MAESRDVEWQLRMVWDAGRAGNAISPSVTSSDERPASRRWLTPRQLPARGAPLVGRAEQLAGLDETLLRTAEGDSKVAFALRNGGRWQAPSRKVTHFFSSLLPVLG